MFCKVETELKNKMNEADIVRRKKCPMQQNH